MKDKVRILLFPLRFETYHSSNAFETLPALPTVTFMGFWT